MFKGFSLGCLVVGPSLILKKENLAEMVTLRHLFSLVVIRCHSLSFLVPLVVTRCHSFSLVVPLVVIRCHSLYHSLSLVVPLVVTRCTTRLSFYKRSHISNIKMGRNTERKETDIKNQTCYYLMA